MSDLRATLTEGLEPPLVSMAKDATQAAEAFEESMSSVRAKPPEGHIAEEVWEPCVCEVRPFGHVLSSEQPRCLWCDGSGWRATKRIIRPMPKPDFNEQAALAQLKTKDALLLRAAKTLDYNADILLAAGKRIEAGQTKQAAQAIREAVGAEG